MSCNPNGARPTGPSGFPGGTPWRTVDQKGMYQPRVLSDDGSRVFFDSIDALVPQDMNGVQDVYEWEQDGVGTCKREGGCVFLISDGTSTSDSSIVDASASGNDVFFITRTRLSGWDTDELRDLYDARVGGGFMPPPPPAPVCEGEDCRPPPSPTMALSPLASTTFSGVGNLLPVPPKPAARKVKAKKRRSKSKRHRTQAKKAVRRTNAGISHRPERR